MWEQIKQYEEGIAELNRRLTERSNEVIDLKNQIANLVEEREEAHQLLANLAGYLEGSDIANEAEEFLNR